MRGLEGRGDPPFDPRDRFPGQDQTLASIVGQPDVANTVFRRRERDEPIAGEVPHDAVHRLTGHPMTPCQLTHVKHGCHGELLQNVELRGREIKSAQGPRREPQPGSAPCGAA